MDATTIDRLQSEKTLRERQVQALSLRGFDRAVKEVNHRIAEIEALLDDRKYLKNKNNEAE